MGLLCRPQHFGGGTHIWRFLVPRISAHFSTFSEPQAVINALCHLLDPLVPQFVRILTDNTVTQASFQPENGEQKA